MIHLALLSSSLPFSLSVSLSLPFQCSIMHTVPIEIIRAPPGETVIDNNTLTTLSVDFNGRMGQNIQITWEKDGRPLPAEYQVITTYNSLNSPPTGRTSLTFSQRKDTGVYRVIVSSTLGAGSVPSSLLTDETSFQVNVIGKSIWNLHTFETIA